MKSMLPNIFKNKKHEKKVLEYINKLSQLLDYQFNDQSLLVTALTHRSQSLQNSAHGPNNERLEFLGDAVLSLITAEFLFKEKAHLNEGYLSRLRAEYVCQTHLSNSARLLNLKDYIMGDSSMKTSGSNNSPSVLSDAVEAIIGAAYIDGGLEAAKQLVFKILGKPSLEIINKPKDARTELQEYVQSLGMPTPEYIVISSEGPDHCPNFQSSVKIGDEVISTGRGESKKAAAQDAASKAFVIYKNKHG